MNEARQELHRIILDREMKEALLLVFANKQDLPNALTPQQVQEELRLNQLKDKIWSVVPSTATTGDGLFEGLVGHPPPCVIEELCVYNSILGLAVEQCQDASDAKGQISFYIPERSHCIIPLRLSIWRCF